MSELVVQLSTQHHEKDMVMPGVGITRLGLDVVMGIQLPNSTARTFSHYLFEGEGQPGVEKVTLPQAMAERLDRFSQDHFVEGRPNFDCRAFLHFMMGWEDEVRTGIPKTYYGNYVSPDQTKPTQPYLIAVKEGPTPHAMLGIDTPAHSLGVIGFEFPLVVAKNADLIQAFGGFALLEVTSAANPVPNR